MLEIIDKKRENNRTYYLCKCDCGNIKWIRADSVKKGQRSCGCFNNTTKFKAKDITGETFRRLKTVRPTDKRASNGTVIWECKCECGNIKEISSGDLIRGAVKSCGCLGREMSVKHGTKVGELNVTKNVIENTHLKLITNSMLKTNTTGYKGVSFDKERNKYLAQIVFKKKHYNLGRYDTAEEASEVYQKAKKELHLKFLDEYKDKDLKD